MCVNIAKLSRSLRAICHIFSGVSLRSRNVVLHWNTVKKIFFCSHIHIKYIENKGYYFTRSTTGDKNRGQSTYFLWKSWNYTMINCNFSTIFFSYRLEKFMTQSVHNIVQQKDGPKRSAIFHATAQLALNGGRW